MTEKTTSKQEVNRERILKFYLENRDEGKMFAVNHFLSEKMPKRNIYMVIERGENEFGHKRRVGSERQSKIMTNESCEHI